MGKLQIWVCVFFIASMSTAQTISVSGKVSNASGQAISGAVVELINQGLTDTTGADGMYAFNGTVGTLRPTAAGGYMTMANGKLQIHLTSPSPVDVTTYDVHGKLLKQIAVENASVGFHSWDLEEKISQSGMRIVRVAAAGETRTFRYMSLGLSGSSSHSVTNATPLVEARFSKMAAAVDSIRVTAAGYPVTTMEVASYSATVNLSLTASSDNHWGGMKNPPMPSSGCGKTSLTSGTYKINSAGLEREYILEVPDNYDANTPSRMIFTMHWMDGSAQAVQRSNFYSYILYDKEGDKNVILVAPQGYTDGSPWRGRDDKDHSFFEDLHSYLLSNLCVDSSRVFMTGFSFGGMITYSLSTDQQQRIRASAGFAPANYNIFIPDNKSREPIAWMQTTGMRDGLCPWDGGGGRGAKYIALEHAEDNGCTLPANNDIPTWKSGGHFCYDFEGCNEGYPTKACTFGGAHTDLNSDPGSNENWLHTVSWDFFHEF